MNRLEPSLAALAWRPVRIMFLLLSFAAVIAWTTSALSASGMETAVRKVNTSVVNLSPNFESGNGWSSGFTLAQQPDGSVIVGPGSTNPNVFAQSFQVREGEQFRVVARASSAVGNVGKAAIQINWTGKDGAFLGVARRQFVVTDQEARIVHTVVVPPGALQGVLYVAPGDEARATRYRAMELHQMGPVTDFLSYRFFGVRGRSLLASTGAAVLGLVLIFFWRRRLYRLIAASVDQLARCFPVTAPILCGLMFVFLEGHYEQHYDSSWHQSLAENVLQWNDLSLAYGGNILNNFGIQHPLNSLLSPTFLLGDLFPADYRIPIQGAVQAIVIFLLLSRMCRIAGVSAADAAAISLIASGYLWIPELSSYAITLNATLGLLWQEGAIATLITFLCFIRIGCCESGRAARVWPFLGFVGAVIWFSLAYPLMIAYFTLATTGLCLGALAGVDSKKELRYKLGAAAGLVVVLLAAGFHHYVLNLFMYTPQMYFKTLYNHDFSSLFFSNTSLLLASERLGGGRLLLFFGFAAVGTFAALWRGNGFARRVALGALGLEIFIHSASALNAMLRIVPLTFTYAEQMGVAAVALMAGLGAWTVVCTTIMLLKRCALRVTTRRRIASV